MRMLHIRSSWRGGEFRHSLPLCLHCRQPFRFFFFETYQICRLNIQFLDNPIQFFIRRRILQIFNNRRFSTFTVKNFKCCPGFATLWIVVDGVSHFLFFGYLINTIWLMKINRKVFYLLNFFNFLYY